jgi:hypothetical protein
MPELEIKGIAREAPIKQNDKDVTLRRILATS